MIREQKTTMTQRLAPQFPWMEQIAFKGMTVSKIEVPTNSPNDFRVKVRLTDGRPAAITYQPQKGVWVQIEPNSVGLKHGLNEGTLSRPAKMEELKVILTSLEQQKAGFIRRNSNQELDYKVLVQQVAKSATRLLSFVPETTPGRELGFTRLVGTLDSARGIHGWIGYNSKGEFFAKKGRTPQIEEEEDGRSDTIWDEPQVQMTKIQMKETSQALLNYIQTNPNEASRYADFMKKLESAIER